MSQPGAKPKEKLLRVLNLEDNPGDSGLIKAELETGWKEVVLLRVGTREAFVQALDEFKPDVVLSAFRLRDFDGRTALGIVRQTHPYIPVIIVTGVLADIEAVDLVKMGAADYVMKDHLQHLSSAVQDALSGEQGIRARKAMEHALRESEVRYQAIMSSVNDAIVCIRPDDIVYLWNRKAEEMFGYKAAEAIGQNLHQLITPERYRKPAAEALPQFAKTGSGAIVGTTRELTVRRKDSSEFPVELSVSAMNINGEWHATGIIRDISERKQAEAKIQRLNRLYALLSQCDQIIVRSVNETELFTQICQSSVQFGGFSMVWVGLIDPGTRMLVPAASSGEGAEAYLREIKISASADSEYGGGPAGISIRENRPFWCQDFQNSSLTEPWHERAAIPGWRSAASLPLRREGVVIGTIMLYSGELNVFDEDTRGLLTDMNADIDFALDNFGHEAERKRAEKALSDSRNLLKTIIDTSPMRLFWKDKELRYMGCNPAFAKDAGEADPEHLIGKDDFQLGWKEQAELYRADDRLVMNTGVPKLSYDEMRPAPDGTTIWLRTSKVPLRNAANETIGVLGMYEDITERKLVELALQRSEADLNRAQAVAQIGSWRLDIATNRLEWSAEAHRIFGIPGLDAVDLDTFLSTIHPDDRERVLNAWNEAVVGAPYDIEHRVVAGGEIRWVRERAVIERDAQGRALCGIGTTQDITARRHAEDELRQLSLAVEQSPNSIVITDLDANLEYVNDAFVKATGYSRAEAIGQNPRILHSGKTSRATYDDMWAHLTRGDVWKGEFINRRKDGSEFIESILASPVRDADGRTSHYLGIKEDITERRQAERMLRDSRESLERLLNSMAEGAYGMDTDGNCTFVNRAFMQLLGYQNGDELIGKYIHDLIHHSHADGSPYPESECRIYRACQLRQSSSAADEVFWRKDGVAIPVEYWSHPIIVDGVVVGAIVTFIDITERKRVEKALLDSEEKFRTLYESASDAFMLLDEKGFFDCNETTLRMFGCSTRNEFVTKHPSQFSPPTQPGGEDSVSLANERIATAFKNGSNRFEWMHSRLDGGEFPAEVLLKVMKLGGREVLQATVRDITERKRIEAQLAAEYQHVAGMNAQLIESNKKLEQAQNQLLQSEKMAAIGLLAAGVAHEINNPVGYVNSNLGTLEKYLADIFVVMDKYEAAEVLLGAGEPQLEELRQFKAKIDLGYIREDTRSLIAESHQGLERVKRIILDLKEFSHAESEDHWVWADVHQGLESTLNVVWNELKYKCEVVKEYGILPKIYCLPTQLDQVFMNLLVNAAQAIEVRGKITLRTGQEGDRVWVEVSDTGKGIPPEDMLRLFNPFFTTKPVGQGTGLGLAVSYRIMEKHHGKIEVKSEVGKGSIFRVWLPVQQPNTQEQA